MCVYNEHEHAACGELVPGPALADVLRPADLGPRQVAVLRSDC